MLILQRRRGESVCINNDIKITISDIGSEWVKLAIDAPKGIPILRSELQEAVMENQKASQITSSKTLQKLIKNDNIHPFKNL